MNVYSWLRLLQHFTGVFNAYGVFVCLEDDNWFGMVICAVCVALTASWRIYPGMADDHKKGKK